MKKETLIGKYTYPMLGYEPRPKDYFECAERIILKHEQEYATLATYEVQVHDVFDEEDFLQLHIITPYNEYLVYDMGHHDVDSIDNFISFTITTIKK